MTFRIDWPNTEDKTEFYDDGAVAQKRYDGLGVMTTAVLWEDLESQGPWVAGLVPEKPQEPICGPGSPVGTGYVYDERVSA